MSEEKEEKKEKATEGKTVDMKSKVEQATEEIEKHREEQKKLCSSEIKKVLEKYNCNLTARMIIGEQGNMPQVLIINMPDKKDE